MLVNWVSACWASSLPLATKAIRSYRWGLVMGSHAHICARGAAAPGSSIRGLPSLSRRPRDRLAKDVNLSQFPPRKAAVLQDRGLRAGTAKASGYGRIFAGSTPDAFRGSAHGAGVNDGRPGAGGVSLRSAACRPA